MSTELLERIEVYLDAAPRTATEPEAVGKFTLFRPLGPWGYYARPRLGLDQPIERADVDQLRTRQRELKLGEKLEWFTQMTPTLAAAAQESGLSVHQYPMLALLGGKGADIPAPAGSTDSAGRCGRRMVCARACRGERGLWRSGHAGRTTGDKGARRCRCRDEGNNARFHA